MAIERENKRERKRRQRHTTNISSLAVVVVVVVATVVVVTVASNAHQFIVSMVQEESNLMSHQCRRITTPHKMTETAMRMLIKEEIEGRVPGATIEKTIIEIAIVWTKQ